MQRTIGICLWSLMPLSFVHGKSDYKVFKTVAELGVEYIDFIEDYVPCHPNVSLGELADLRKQVKNLGLKIGQVWFYMDLVGGVHASSFDRIGRDLKDYLHIVAEMGGRFLSIPLILDRPGLSIAEGYKQFANVIGECLPTAEEVQIPITLEYARSNMAAQAIRMAREIGSDYLRLTPDFEAWRLATADIPLVHVEAPGSVTPGPASLEQFVAALPYSPNIHAKLLAFDEKGEEPHFPIAEMMNAINQSRASHHLSIEYEGWIPDINPHLDCIAETKKCVALLRRYLRPKP